MCSCGLQRFQGDKKLGEDETFGLLKQETVGKYVMPGHYVELYSIIEGSLEVKLPTIWTDEKQRWEESERREE
jgi:hypothetical protein